MTSLHEIIADLSVRLKCIETQPKELLSVTSQSGALDGGLPPSMRSDILHDTSSDVTNGRVAPTHTYSDAVRNNDHSVIREIVAKSIKDSKRRKLNVIVTGIPETTDDARAFIDFCEQHLTMKPFFSQRGVVRLGTVTSESGRP